MKHIIQIVRRTLAHPSLIPLKKGGLSGGSAKDACKMADLFVMTDNSRKLYANKFSGTN